MKAILPLVLAAALFGCATPYQSKGFYGGYSETQLGLDLFRVSYTGNSSTSPARIEDFALLRAAELTLQHGFTHFQILSASDHSRSVAYTTPTVSTTNVTAHAVGNTGYAHANTITQPGISAMINNPAVGIVVRCFKTKPDGVAFDADFLQKTLKKKYGMG